MDYDKINRKLAILADAAKYDVSCSSSGGSRKNDGGLGNSSRAGICHSFTEDGRCVSLLKILLTNHCIYDCAYCVSRRSNDVPRAAFTVEEVVDLTMSFYRRNYIEGLFLSSGIFKNADYTMERLVRIAKKLRTEHRFNGYIHLKAIPKASDEILQEAGRYADRLSINMEIPTVSGLERLAPEKKHTDITQPMLFVKNEIAATADSRKTIKSTPKFAPAGQSTQLIIGASGENDRQIIHAAGRFYQNYGLKRVYYSGYVPVLEDSRLPPLSAQVPLRRENRLYQADFLLRGYDFTAGELLSGPGDLALCTGKPATDPANAALIDKLVRVANARGVPCGTAVGDAAAALQARAKGFNFVMVSNDVSMFAKTAQGLMQGIRA